MNLGVIVAASAGNHAYEYGQGYIAATYPAALAVSRLPTIIRVGAVDEDGIYHQHGRSKGTYTPVELAFCVQGRIPSPSKKTVKEPVPPLLLSRAW